MKQYELTYLTSAILPENDLKALQDRVGSLISEAEGSVIETKPAMKKELDYPIKGESIIFVNTLFFNLSPEKLDGLEKKISEEKNIVSRMFLVKEPEKFTEMRRRVRKMPAASQETATISEKPKKVEIKEIEKKLEEILGE